jgi:hypothetical protein
MSNWFSQPGWSVSQKAVVMAATPPPRMATFCGATCELSCSSSPGVTSKSKLRWKGRMPGCGPSCRPSVSFSGKLAKGCSVTS